MAVPQWRRSGLLAATLGLLCLAAARGESPQPQLASEAETVTLALGLGEYDGSLRQLGVATSQQLRGLGDAQMRALGLRLGHRNRLKEWQREQRPAAATQKLQEPSTASAPAEATHAEGAAAARVCAHQPHVPALDPQFCCYLPAAGSERRHQRRAHGIFLRAILDMQRAKDPLASATRALEVWRRNERGLRVETLLHAKGERTRGVDAARAAHHCLMALFPRGGSGAPCPAMTMYVGSPCERRCHAGLTRPLVAVLFDATERGNASSRDASWGLITAMLPALHAASADLDGAWLGDGPGARRRSPLGVALGAAQIAAVEFLTARSYCGMVRRPNGDPAWSLPRRAQPPGQRWWFNVKCLPLWWWSVVGGEGSSLVRQLNRCPPPLAAHPTQVIGVMYVTASRLLRVRPCPMT